MASHRTQREVEPGGKRGGTVCIQCYILLNSGGFLGVKGSIPQHKGDIFSLFIAMWGFLDIYTLTVEH